MVHPHQTYPFARNRRHPSCLLSARQAEGLLSPQGKKIPSRGVGAARVKQEKACLTIQSFCWLMVMMMHVIITRISCNHILYYIYILYIYNIYEL